MTLSYLPEILIAMGVLAIAGIAEAVIRSFQ